MAIIKFEDYIKLNKKEELVVGIGQFDGLHIAHRQIISVIEEIGKNKNFKTAIITFDPHPDFVLGKKEKISNVMTLEEKANELELLGIDYLIIINFDINFSKVCAEDYVKEYLLKLNVKEVVVGSDFIFGSKGLGKGYMISEYSNHLIKVNVIPEMKYENEKIGTEKIKELLKQGDISKINKLLGRNFMISGIVVRGRQIGRKVGFPTINLVVREDFVEIKKGVYAVRVYHMNKQYNGIANVGNNPSFNYKERVNLEVHIFDFNEDLYDQLVSVELIDFIREEVKFSSVDDFKEQLKQDIEKTLVILNKSVEKK